MLYMLKSNKTTEEERKKKISYEIESYSYSRKNSSGRTKWRSIAVQKLINIPNPAIGGGGLQIILARRWEKTPWGIIGGAMGVGMGWRSGCKIISREQG